LLGPIQLPDPQSHKERDKDQRDNSQTNARSKGERANSHADGIYNDIFFVGDESKVREPLIKSSVAATASEVP
jgi:hypothetical protein